MSQGPDGFLEALTDSSLYSIGAFFCDQHPELVDDVLAQAGEIEQAGLARWAQDEGVELEAAFQTLVTGARGALLQGGRRDRLTARRRGGGVRHTGSPRGVAQPGSAHRSGR